MDSKNKIKLRYYGDPLLLRKSTPLTIKDCQTEDTKNIINIMITIMLEHNGIGFSAPQIGINKKIITINSEAILHYINNNQLELYKSSIVLINPKIISISNKKIINEEGCLSIPGIFAQINRYEEIKLESINYPSMKKISICCDGILSIILQHEIDHLNGILFINKLNNTEYDLNKLNNF